MIKKNILFIAHNNNSYDHYLPLIINLKKDSRIEVKTLAFYHKYSILENKLHNYISEKNNNEIDSMIDICNLSFLNKKILRIYKLTSMKQINKEGGFFNQLANSILTCLQNISVKYFVICSFFFLSDKRIRKYIDHNNIDLLIIDHRKVDEKIDLKPIDSLKKIIAGELDPMNCTIFRFGKICREKKIPMFMMPHGPQPISKKIGINKNRNKNPFQPDYFVIVKEDELLLNPQIQPLKAKLILGDPRFDIGWIKYLESCALKVYGSSINKPKDKIVLLYLMDKFTFTSVNNKRYKAELNKDVLSLVNYFPNLEIWVKHHPRNVYDLSLDNFIDKNKIDNIKQFGNDTDTNALLVKSDICLSAASTVIISPILQKKPVIFYDKWKEKHIAKSIYDELPFKASSKEELIIQVKRIINGEYYIDDSYLEGFYKNVFSANSLYENMTGKYSKKIKEILGIDNN